MPSPSKAWRQLVADERLLACATAAHWCRRSSPRPRRGASRPVPSPRRRLRRRARAAGGAQPSPTWRHGCPTAGLRPARRWTARRAAASGDHDGAAGDEPAGRSRRTPPPRRRVRPPGDRGRAPALPPAPSSHSTWPSSCQSAVTQSRRASAASTSSSPVIASRAPGTRRAAASSCPGRSSVLLGMHAQYEHSPPSSSASTTAIESPQSVQRPATFSPAGPPPITTTSNSSAWFAFTPQCVTPARPVRQ